MKHLIEAHLRRDFLRRSLAGIGTLALTDLMRGATVADPLAPKAPHYAPKAKNVIFLFQEGAPSQMDLFDPKPGLQKWHGQSLPPSMTKDMKLAFIKPTAKILASPRKFAPQGQSGMLLSDLIPHTAKHADDICLIRSMHSEAFNHHPGQLLLFSGHMTGGRPSMGAWTTYGLGSESKNLPAFVALQSGPGASAGSDLWTNGFLPSLYQGTVLRSSGDPILYLSNAPGFSNEAQRARLDVLKDLNTERQNVTGDLEIASRIHSYELAYRMQSAGPELTDLKAEKPETLDMYGINEKESRQYGTNLLLARRLVERGVRFVLCVHSGWDHHSAINGNLPKLCAQTDKPTAALLTDLKQRGLLNDTLVVWGGEFGRTPMSEIRRPDEADNAGRDHHPNGYSIWMAGGGVKPGMTLGATDELALNITEDRVGVHDLQATIMHLLGMDHTKLTYRHMGRDFRLTDVHGEVVKKILA
ncbi:sulfatase [Bryobacterales bacterium F-183]|nr:sulfatase [Bryobacterales bacterium F-183]